MQDDVIICKQVIASTLAKAAQTTGYPSIIKGIYKSDLRLPNPSVIQGTLDLATSGSVNGMGSGVTAEAVLPNGSLSRGKIICLDVEMGTGASSSWGSAGPVALSRFDIWGGGAAYANTNAFFMEIGAGIAAAEGTGQMYSAGASAPAVTATLKVNISGVGTKYLMLCDAEAN